MAANKFDRNQRDQIMAEISAMNRQGLDQVEMAKAVGLTQPQVCKYLKKLDKLWQKSALVDTNVVKMRVLQKIYDLEMMNKRGYAKSQGSKSKHTKAKKQQVDRDGDVVNLVDDTDVTWEDAGDPRFLTNLQNLAKLEVEIHGLAAPQKVDTSVTVSSFADALRAAASPEILQAALNDGSET